MNTTNNVPFLNTMVDTFPEELLIQMYSGNVAASRVVCKRLYHIFNNRFTAINKELAEKDLKINAILADKSVKVIIIDGIPSSLPYTKLIFKYLNSKVEDEGFFLTANTVYNGDRINWAYRQLKNIPPFFEEESKKDLKKKADDFRYFLCSVKIISSNFASISPEDRVTTMSKYKILGNQQFAENLSRYPEDLREWNKLSKTDTTLLIPSTNYQLQYLPKEIGDLKNLERINLNGHKIKLLPAQLKDLKLKTLLINNNPFVNFPSVILKITTLKELSVISCELTSLPEGFGNLINLKNLNLSNNKLNNLPSSFKNLKNLEYLDISFNPLKNGFPVELEELPQLTKLLMKGKKKDGFSETILNNPKIHVVGEGWKKKPVTLLGKFPNPFKKSEKKDKKK